MNATPLLAAVVFWLAAWALNEWLVRQHFQNPLARRIAGVAVPLLFGITLLVLWEGIVRGFDVPSVLLPPPSAIWQRLVTSLPTLWADFRQTFLKSVITGYVLGCGLGFIVAILIDRSPFLQKGLLPLGNFVSALPVIGVAPIMVMWFGFDWQSKVAVVVIMTFFPMLVNTVAGLAAASHIERDLMRTYAASWWQTLVKLRLPAAWPFIFNALKINSTLALIGAIVAEFFGFDWQSKVAVVVIMTFFPMLVNTVAGLAAASHMERDLMRTYAANWWQTLVKLRLPAAWPFIFNALKINSTLALIGAIVAEFFGTPIVGMGFRISTEVGRMNVDMVWAEIAVAALAGSIFYGVVALVERAVTFWHPSVRGGQA